MPLRIMSQVEQTGNERSIEPRCAYTEGSAASLWRPSPLPIDEAPVQPPAPDSRPQDIAKWKPSRSLARRLYELEEKPLLPNHWKGANFHLGSWGRGRYQMGGIYQKTTRSKPQGRLTAVESFATMVRANSRSYRIDLKMIAAHDLCQVCKHLAHGSSTYSRALKPWLDSIHLSISRRIAFSTATNSPPHPRQVTFFKAAYAHIAVRRTGPRPTSTRRAWRRGDSSRGWKSGTSGRDSMQSIP